MLYHVAEAECMTGDKKDRKAHGYLCLEEDMGHAQRKTTHPETEYSGVP